MKSFKTCHENCQSPRQPASNLAKVKPLIYSFVKLDRLKKYQYMIKKNYFSRNISFASEKPLLKSKIITIRNTKYLKKLNPYIIKLDSSADSIKYAKSLQSLNMIYDFKVWVDFYRLQKIRMPFFYTRVMKMVLKGNCKLKEFKSGVPIFHRAFSAKKLTKVQSVYIAVNKQVCNELEKGSENLPSVQDAILYKTLDKFSELRHLEQISLQFDMEFHTQEFFFGIFQKLSSVEALRALCISLVLQKSPECSIKMEEIMKKFSNLTKLSLTLNFLDGASDKIFLDLMPLPNLKYLNITIHVPLEFNLKPLGALLSSLESLVHFNFGLTYKPEIKNAKGSSKDSFNQNKIHNYRQEFYNYLEKLARKLEIFKLTLGSVPIDISQRLLKIVNLKQDKQHSFNKVNKGDESKLYMLY